MLKYHEEAEDMVQEIMLKLRSMRDKLNQHNSIVALAIQMLRNACLNKRKAKERMWVDHEGLQLHSSGINTARTLEGTPAQHFPPLMSVRETISL
jgi:DNA-directed RNA polymerase specialized sigma24 family protein